MTAEIEHDPARPPIILRESQEAALYALALDTLLWSPRAAGPLLDELERARVLPDAEVRRDVAGLGSFVEFSEDGVLRTLQLVTPVLADERRGRVSVLTPVGAALLGLSPGQRILWCDRVGSSRPLTVLTVRPGRLVDD